MKKKYGMLVGVGLLVTGLYAVILKNDFVNEVSPAELKIFIEESRPDIKFETGAVKNNAFKKLGFTTDKEWLAYLKAKPATTTTAAPLIPLEIRKLAKKSKYGATEAHLSILQNRNAIAERYGFSVDPSTPIGAVPLRLVKTGPKGPVIQKLKRYEDLLNAVIKRENEYKDTHFVFYHALSKAWIVPQDLYFKLYSYLRPLSADITDFRFLRWQAGAEKTVSEFLMKQMEDLGLVNDNSPDGRMSLLSVNLALFGNVTFDGECTWEYFRKPKSHASVGVWAFESILDQFSVVDKQKYIDRLMKLDEQYLTPEKLDAAGETQEQVLLQIFIPKFEIDSIGYISWIKGVPRQDELVAWVENESKTDMKYTPYFAKSDKVLEDIASIFKKEGEKNPVYKTLIDGIKNGSYGLSKILNIYTNTPELIPDLNYLQARILVTAALWYPKKDVRMYDYHLIPEERMKAYHAALDEIVAEIAQDVLTRAKKESVVQR